MMQAMVRPTKAFTKGELNALSYFYGSPTGKRYCMNARQSSREANGIHDADDAQEYRNA